MDFTSFGPEEDLLLRTRVAKTSGFSTTDPQKWALEGTLLSFYRNKTWLCFVAELGPDGSGERRYFLVRFGDKAKRRTIAFYLPIANKPGEIARANRELRTDSKLPLKLNAKNIVEYLHFYYLFTPRQDPLLRNLNYGPTQFFVPLAFDDLPFDGRAHQPTSAKEPCSPLCLARGAAWRFLDEETHQRTAPIKFRSRLAAPRVSGRILIQFLDALFAVDFRVPLSTGVPVLSNPDLLYQSTTLDWPESGVDVPLPRTIGIREVLDDLVKEAAKTIRRLGARIAQFVWSTATVLIVCTWIASALFPLLEGLGQPWLKRGLTTLARYVSLSGWPQVLFAITCIGLFFALATIFYTTHMDKIFNLIFSICPKGLRPLIAPLLNSWVDKRDRDFNAQDTFHKRAAWALGRFLSWTAYLVLAFASLQIALNAGEDLLRVQGTQSDTSTWRIIATLAVQALLNIPLLFYALTYVRDLGHFLDPGTNNAINSVLLVCFHLAMAAIVIKGVIRMWVLTVEASPHAFYRRLRIKGETPPPRPRKR